MKKLLGLLIMSTSLTSISAMADTETVTKPVSVVVFTDQATVTRSGDVEIPAGDSILLVKGLPKSLNRESLKVDGKSVSKVTIGSIDVKIAPINLVNVADNPSVNQEIKTINEELDKVAVEIASYETQKALILRLAGSTTSRVVNTDAGLDSNPASWNQALDAVQKGMLSAGEGNRLATRHKTELEQRKAVLTSSNRATINADLETQVGIAVHAEQATRFHLNLSYRIQGASWHPVYEAYLDSKTGKLVLNEGAQVSQFTGEDWKDVSVVLSTSRPSASTSAPNIGSIPIDIQETAPPETVSYVTNGSGTQVTLRAHPSTPSASRDTMGVATPWGVADTMGVAAAAASPAPMVAQVEASNLQTTAITTGLFVEYAIPGKNTIPSDRTEKHVRIGETTFDSKVTARIVPKFDAKAYLMTDFVNNLDVPLMPGRVSLNLDGVLVGQGNLNLTRKAEHANLAFGPDEQIKVSYDPQTSHQSQDGYWNKQAINTRESLITIKSFHPSPIEITVLDALPVSRNETLKVVMNADPKPSITDFEQKPGVLAWTKIYAVNEENKIKFGYTVTAPDGKTITGLPR
jgi:uncharacterized protein (TIGR02231 family)